MKVGDKVKVKENLDSAFAGLTGKAVKWNELGICLKIYSSAMKAVNDFWFLYNEIELEENND